MSEADLAAVNARLEELLAAEGARLDAIFHCPHEKGACDCRKPGTGMFERAAREVEGVEIEGGAMVGDSAIDVEAGNRLGLTTVRLGTAAGATRRRLTRRGPARRGPPGSVDFPEPRALLLLFDDLADQLAHVRVPGRLDVAGLIGLAVALDRALLGELVEHGRSISTRTRSSWARSLVIFGPGTSTR